MPWNLWFWAYKDIVSRRGKEKAKIDSIFFAANLGQSVFQAV